MQTDPTIQQKLSAQRASSSGFIPPSWSDLGPLLRGSLLLWATIAILAAFRSALRRYFRSETFRAMLKRAKRQQHSHGPLVRVARAFRHLRITLARNRFPETATAQYFGLPRFIAGVVVCVLYIINTYMQGIPIHYYIIQCVYGVTITINLLVSFVYADRPVHFVFSLKTIVECLSIPSLLLSSDARWLNFNFLQAYCILVEWGTLEKHDIVLRNYSTMSRLLINLFLQLLTFLFVTSCGVQFFELLGDPGQALRSETFQITWANAVYFAVVTLMTVGYGDFVPYTLLGRMWIVFHIIFAAYLVSREISLLIDALKSMRRGGGSYVNSSGTDHVVVTGRIKWEFLQQFVKEFLAESTNLDTKVIVLASNPTWTEDDWIRFVSHDPFFDHHLMYLEGSALRIDDLSRASVSAARGVFVLADPHGRDPYKEDSDILKAVLTIRNYSGTVPIYTLNTLQESSFQFGIAMDHLEPTPTDLLHNFQSGLVYSRTFFGLPQTPSVTEAEEHLRPKSQVQNSHSGCIGPRSPDPRLSGQVQGPGESSVLGDEDGNLYSLEERLGAVASSFDGNSAQGVPMDRSEKYPRSKYNGQELKSENLCMQELETVMLAENVFCNGLSTLLANATLRVAPQPNRNDRPWLMEYKLGAECSILQLRIPQELDGKVFGKVVTVLQDYGLVLLAMRTQSGNDWVLLTTETVLEANALAMVLSYHDHSVVRKIAEHAAKFIRSTERRRERNSSAMGMRSVAGPAHSLEIAEISERTELDHVDLGPASISTTGLDTKKKHITKFIPVLGNGNSEKLGHTRLADNHIGRASDLGPAPESHAHRVRVVPKSVITRSLSTTTDRDRKKFKKGHAEDKKKADDRSIATASRSSGVEGKRSHVTSKESQKRSKKLIYTNMDKLPAALRGHVIICLDGESPLISLEALLKRIWQPRSTLKKKAPVVVIHPRFPKNFARQLGGYEERLFLLQGNSLSLDTLKQAQYQNARAFLIMASESSDTSGGGSTDSKAIFTMMTLDSLLADRVTFVCCVLDAEESLQLLRAPRQARRVGVNLGEHREPDLFNFERSPLASIPHRSASSTSLIRNLPSTPFTSNLRKSSLYGTFANLWSTGTAKQPFAKRLEPRNRPNLKGITRSTSMRFVQDDSSDDDDRHGSDIHTLKYQHHMQERSREEYYERQRYASGEMVISSLFTALLTREHTDPGYIRFIRQLIGAASGSPGSWIRQVDVPESWTQLNKEDIDGRTYRQTSIKLLEFGCIALGLYRSGDAPVRIETKSEQWERRVSEVVYLREEEIKALRNDAESRSMATRLIANDRYADRRLGRAVGHRTQGSENVTDLNTQANNFPFSELLRGQIDEADEFDRMYYLCPSTKRRILFQEAVNGENVLPYVYCCPEPYSLVAASDAVFVLCRPETKIPADWGEG